MGALLIPPDSHTRSSIGLELGVEDLKLEGMSTHFRRGGLSPTKVLARALSGGPAGCCLDVDSRASVLLEGEQNSTSSCVGSEQHHDAAPCAPQNSSFSPLSLVPPSPESAARGIPPREGVASEQHAVDPRLEVLKPPDSNGEPLEEPRGVCLGGTEPACVAENADAGTTIERTGVGAHEPGGVPFGSDRRACLHRECRWHRTHWRG